MSHSALPSAKKSSLTALDFLLLPNPSKPFQITFPAFLPPHDSDAFPCELRPFGPWEIRRMFALAVSTVKRLYRRPVSNYISSEDRASFIGQMYSHYLQPVVHVFEQLKAIECESFRIERTVIDESAFSVRCFFPDQNGPLPFPTGWFIALTPGSLNASEWEHADKSSPAVSSLMTVAEPPVAVGDWVLVSDVQTSILLQLMEVEGERRTFHSQVLYEPSSQASDYDQLTPVVGPSLRLALTVLLLHVVGFFYLDSNVDESRSGLFEGALNDLGLLSATVDQEQEDKGLLLKYRSILDFDRYTLTQDLSRAKEFFRWKKMAFEETRRLAPGDVLVAETGAFQAVGTNPHPLKPLPSDTQQYLEAIRRPQPKNLILGSSKFSLQITRVLKSVGLEKVAHDASDTETDYDSTKSEAGNIATVCECRLVAVNGVPVASDDRKLCVKILDDRLLNLDGLGDDEGVDNLWRHFQLALTSEDLVRREDAAYRRLEHAQGSVVPYYYGCHMFILPDGHQCYGLVMEFIEGAVVPHSGLPELTKEEQIKFVRGARHALRVLQHADISQWDWHQDQMMRLPDGSCVFIDFGSALQSDQAYDGELSRDYDDVFRILCKDAGIDRDLVKANFAPKEEWDFSLY